MAAFRFLLATTLATFAATSAHAEPNPERTANAAQASTDLLLDGFRSPPQSARPFVWWHWMNGNVTSEGARLDLEWMKRIGIGGVQVFEGNLFTPQLVDQRLPWMSPGWKAAMRESVDTAARLGLDFGIATSPGWSISGAPFVLPQNAMKKLVWSETLLEGGKGFEGQLVSPPAVSGPFQDVAGTEEVAPFYRDVLVLAVPDGGGALTPDRIVSSAGPSNAHLLQDGAFGPVEQLPYSKEAPEAWLRQDFGKPVTIRSVTLGLPGGRGFGAPPVPEAVLEVSDDGVAFRAVVKLPATRAQVRVASFAPVTGRYFRVRLQLSPSDAALIGSAENTPGLVPLPSAAPAAATFDVSEFTLAHEGKVDHAAEKAGFAAADDYYAVATAKDSVADPVARDKVLDITRYMDSRGYLKWRVPKGRWKVLRFGYSLTGHQNGPAPAEATGLEVDKLDPSAVRTYAETYLGLYRDALGPDLAAKGLNALLSDSIEAGAQNWTPALIDEFRRRRGYDPVPWFPALTGTVVESAERTDRFLWDYRRTISELLTQSHYTVLAAVAREHGLKYYSEALEDHRPQLGDDLAMRAAADVPMGAIWTTPHGQKPRQTFVADLQGAASVAHVHGKPLVAAETFTAFGSPWGFAPSDLKATADIAFALGVNRIMIHTSPHQPLTNLKPGMSLAPLLGQYFSRNETWRDMAAGWTDYLARSSFLLQQGRPVADIAYFAGEEAPITGLYGETPVDLPSGRGFDFIDLGTLLEGTSVDADGVMVTKGGARYPLLVLGGSSRFMTLATLRRIRDLVDQGAAVVGSQPVGSPSLGDEKEAFEALADSLWQRPQGAGRHVYPTIDAATAARDISPDWQSSGMDAARLGVLHRQLDDGHVWFVSNQSGQRAHGELSLRVTGLEPEFWFAETGEVRPAGYRVEGGRTIVPLTMNADEAVFIVMKRPARVSSRIVPQPTEREIAKLDAGWQLSLAQVWQGPTRLESWTEASKADVKYFSGTGTYRRSVAVPAAWLAGSKRLFLDLGEVRDIAAVRINGKDVGTAWKKPYRVDVTQALRKGTNTVEVDVANLWVNRLIGDAQPGAIKHTVTGGPTYTADAKLRPSGLLGPVELIAVEN
ncbi:MAG: glycoside hydrolase [Novosphingobium sp.]|nr:glycoside hydrolase [Novosphingobium sp.]